MINKELEQTLNKFKFERDCVIKQINNDTNLDENEKYRILLELNLLKVDEVTNIKRKLNSNADNLFKEAVEKWGFNTQLAMLEEECQECALAVHKYLNRDRNEKHYLNLIEEIADVIITIRQAEILLNEFDIDLVVRSKLDRLKERLQK